MYTKNNIFFNAHITKLQYLCIIYREKHGQYKFTITQRTVAINHNYLLYKFIYYNDMNTHNTTHILCTQTSIRAYLFKRCKYSDALCIKQSTVQRVVSEAQHSSLIYIVIVVVRSNDHLDKYIFSNIIWIVTRRKCYYEWHHHHTRGYE